MICTICNAELIEKSFELNMVYHCLKCKTVKRVKNECEHLHSIPVKMRMSNGNFQVKMFCNKCYSIHGSALKQSDFDLNKLHERSFENYNRYLTERINIENENIEEYIQKLNLPGYHQAYIDYLKSSEWGSLRNIILNRDNHKCQICQGKAEQVHHLTYKHLKNEYQFELVSLCTDCHKKHYHE